MGEQVSGLDEEFGGRIVAKNENAKRWIYIAPFIRFHLGSGVIGIKWRIIH